MDSTLKRFISFITVLILSFVFSLAALAVENSPAASNSQKAVKKTAVEKKQTQAKSQGFPHPHPNKELVDSKINS